eukprot:scaffold17254_cov99-Isochrysis_galbana.AAC.11
MAGCAETTWNRPSIPHNPRRTRGGRERMSLARLLGLAAVDRAKATPHAAPVSDVHSRGRTSRETARPSLAMTSHRRSKHGSQEAARRGPAPWPRRQPPSAGETDCSARTEGEREGGS